MKLLALRCARILTILSLILIAGAWHAHAQMTSVGATNNGGAGGGGGLNDVAYDDQHDVYLHVWSTGQIVGQFVNGAGQKVGGAFPVSGPPVTFAAWLRVGYSTGSSTGLFLVAYAVEWNGNRGKSLLGQYIRFNGAGGELVGGAFPLTNVGINPQIAQEAGGIVFNGLTNQFLVSWSDARGGWDVFVRVVNLDGSFPGGEINLTVSGATFEGTPAAAYDWITNRFAIVFNAEVGGQSRTEVVLLDGNTAAPITGRIVISAGGYQDLPGVVFLPETDQFLAFWRHTPVGSITDVTGRVFNADGGLPGLVYPIVATPVFDGVPDGDYNWATRTVLVVAQHDSGYIYSTQLSGGGAPMLSFLGSTVPPKSNGGTFWPHVTAGGNGQFGVSYILNYESAWVERWQAAVSNPSGPRYGGGPAPPPPTPVTIRMSAADAPNGSWMFAEGAASQGSAGFDTFYVIENPYADATLSVRAYFSRDDGMTKEATISVPPGRTAVSLRQIAGVGAYGAVFQCLDPGRQIFVERSVYWGQNWEGSTGELGTYGGSTRWYFAEGSRKGELFSNYFMVFNPTQAPVTLSFGFFATDVNGNNLQPHWQGYTLGPQQRLTVNANDIPALAGTDFRTIIFASGDVVAERAMYWGANWIGGHDSAGAKDPSAEWHFAEGAASPGFETYYTLLNPNAYWVWVQGDYFLEDQDLRAQTGGLVVLGYAMAPYSRKTLLLNEELKWLRGGNVGGVSTRFATAGGAPIVAERSIYWGTPGRWPWVEGTNVVGAVAPGYAWQIPEGTLFPEYDSYILVSNPNWVPTAINIVVVRDDGYQFLASRWIEPYSRLTIDARNNLFPWWSAEAAALNGHSYSAYVASFPGYPWIVVEHALYRQRDGSNYWRAGSASFGFPGR